MRYACNSDPSIIFCYKTVKCAGAECEHDAAG